MDSYLKDFLKEIQKEDSKYKNFGLASLKNGKVIYYFKRCIYDIETYKINYPYFKVLYLPNDKSEYPNWINSNKFNMIDAERIIESKENLWIDSQGYNCIEIKYPVSIGWKFDLEEEDIKSFDDSFNIEKNDGEYAFNSLPKETLLLLMLHHANYFLKKRYPDLRNITKEINYLYYI